MTEPLLVVRHLKTYFPIKKGFLQKVCGYVRAADDVNFDVYAGETFGLVGESGCGKTTTGRSILRLIEPTSGSVVFAGQDVAKLKGRSLLQLSRQMQIVFQNPFGSLDPRFTVRRILEEPMIIHKLCHSAAERKSRVCELLEAVGLPSSCLNQYPDQFSGGQRQRIGIARAIAVQPRLIVADEPVSALDVSVRSQVLNLFKDLREKFSLTYLFIAHDLSVVRHISDHVGVMYLGRIVEMAETEPLFADPLHPYTRALLSAVPIPKPGTKQERVILQGEPPSPSNPPAGCTFHPRCRQAREVCKTVAPEWREVEPGHFVACHLYQ
jgi:oligopeptide/dipeptide ABC transporter ATP-binding protein